MNIPPEIPQYECASSIINAYVKWKKSALSGS